MPIYKESFLIDMLLRKDMEEISLLYDNYAAAIYGVIRREINNEEKANEILTNVFIHFSKELENKDSIRERLFICLYRITTKIIGNCKI
jgi:RNA polymerase sigma-70 factor (ECF subfamily)